MMGLLTTIVGAGVIVETINSHESSARLAKPWRSAIAQAAKTWKVGPHILAGILHTESTFNPDAVGSAGERGIGQMLPIALQDLYEANRIPASMNNLEVLADPATAINLTAAFLDLQRDRCGSMFTAIRAYNVGIGRARQDSSAGSGYLSKVLTFAVKDWLYTNISTGKV